VLATFLIAFLGPWGGTRVSHGGGRTWNFFEAAAESLKDGRTAAVLVLVVLSLVPLLCLTTILYPGLRPVLAIYRGVAALLAPLLLVFCVLALARLGWTELFEAWGPTLYLGSVMIACLVELVPEGAREAPDLENVFR